MCGIFGLINVSVNSQKKLRTLANHAKQRGVDSSGIVFYENGIYNARKADYSVDKLLKRVKPLSNKLILGHSRLITNGTPDNQPVVKENICLLHNGIIVNEDAVWENLSQKRELNIDSEAILATFTEYLDGENNLQEAVDKVFSLCRGTISSALLIPKIGKLLLFSNNGSLYFGRDESGGVCFSSEEFPLGLIRCSNVQQVLHEPIVIDIPLSKNEVYVESEAKRVVDFVPSLNYIASEDKILQYDTPNLRRCSKCILPETMPFISFDEEGVCNYCKNYKIRNKPREKKELFNLVEPYRKKSGNECIVPFSGGRDSCYGLHLIVNELKMKPITYTYDWGMVTDLGRRNISRMCAELGVENIIVSADIAKKRKNIAMNLKAWLKSPHLGMISILTAGDKHFFKYIETVKKQTAISLNLWSINPLEVTHFKAGFLGIPPDFEEKRVYMHGLSKQLRYQYLRLKAMMQSPGYFNSSLWDTLSGEYYRSLAKKSDYFHVFDYWRWDEGLIEATLDGYDWEKAPDTNATWRIGDGTAAFYNYIYYTVAGFTEHDTFRSNQIREGDISREKALELVKDENRPRYQNIKWYLDVLNLDFKDVVEVVNKIPKIYDQGLK